MEDDIPEWATVDIPPLHCSEEEVKQARTDAINSIVLMGIMETEETINKVMLNVTSKRLFTAIYLLCGHSSADTVAVLSKILRNRGNGRHKIKLGLHLCTMNVDVNDLYAFQIIAIGALNFIPPQIKYYGDYQPLIRDTFYRLFEFIKVKNPHAVFITKTAYMLLKKHFLCIDMRVSEHIILSTANTFMLLHPYAKALNHIEKMTDLILNQWSNERKIAEVAALKNLPTWNNLNCYLFSRLLNMWPSGKSAVKYLNNVADRICTMLTDKSITHGALKILEAATNCLELDDWLDIFASRVALLIPVDMLEARVFINGILAQCAWFPVEKYGLEATFTACADLALCATYRLLLLSCGVKQGSISLYSNPEVAEYIIACLESGEDNMEYFALRTLCIFKTKRAVLNQWHVDGVYQYFLRHQLDLDIDGTVAYETFFSHYCVRANFAIDRNDRETTELYTIYLNKFYEQCMTMMTSRNPQQISFGKQMFDLIRRVFEGSSVQLKLGYGLHGEDAKYKENESPFYKSLIRNKMWPYADIKTWRVMFKEFMDCPKLYPEVGDFIAEWCSESLPLDKNDVSHIFFKGQGLLFSQYDYETVERGCVCISIGLADEKLTLRLQKILIRNMSDNLVAGQYPVHNFASAVYFLTNTRACNLTKAACYVLRLRSAAISCNWIDSMFKHAEYWIAKMLEVIVMDDSEEFYTSDVKIVEHMFIVCLEVLSAVVENVELTNSKCYLERSLKLANILIECSNMKRPIVAAAVFVRRLCMEVLSSESSDQVIIIKFLEYVLFSIYAASDHLKSKIRRNPEHRLLIHAIVVADQHRHKHPFLVRAMEFLLGVLSDATSTSGSITSALNSVEIILSDNSLRISTLPYVSTVMVRCINEFSSKDWQIKNATIQVIKSVCNRLLGQKSHQLCRNTIEDIFLMYPELAVNFYLQLRNAHVYGIAESSIVILAVLSESHRKCSKYVCKEVVYIVNAFLRMFVNLISTDTTTNGVFVAKAYAALCQHQYVPFVVRDIVQYLVQNFYKMPKNIFYSFLSLLQALYERFNFFKYVSYYEVGLGIIKAEIQSLTLYLAKFNTSYEFSLFSLLGIRSNRMSDIKKKLRYWFQKPKKPSYQCRMWLHNNVPCLLNNIEIKKYNSVLKTCLEGDFSLSIKLESLHSITNRLNELKTCFLVDTTLLIIIDAFLKLPLQNNYFLVSFTNIFFLLLETCDIFINEDLLTSVRYQYNIVSRSNVYFISIYVGLLSCISSYSKADVIFVKNATVMYKNATVVEDPNLNFHVASTLKYLYKCVQISDRHEVLKLAFMLLLDAETCFEIRKFVTQTFEVQLSSAFEMLEILTSYKHLLTQLGHEFKVLCFLYDLTVLISSLRDFFEKREMFYFRQNSDICSHKYLVKELLLKQIKTAFMLCSRKDCIKLLCDSTCVLLE